MCTLFGSVVGVFFVAVSAYYSKIRIKLILGLSVASTLRFSLLLKEPSKQFKAHLHKLFHCEVIVLGTQ